MAIAVDPKRAIPIIIEEDKKLPEEEQTIFKMLPLTLPEVTDFQELTQGKGAEKEFKLSYIQELMERKLVGWENLKDSEGKVVPFENESKLLRLDMKTVTSIFAATVEANTLQGEDEKN